LSTKEQKN